LESTELNGAEVRREKIKIYRILQEKVSLSRYPTVSKPNTSNIPKRHPITTNIGAMVYTKLKPMP
jgi:hypothetical protein